MTTRLPSCRSLPALLTLILACGADHALAPSSAASDRPGALDQTIATADPPAAADDLAFDEIVEPSPAALRALYAGPPASWPAPTLREGVVHRPLGPVPREAPVARDDPRAVLGRLLFFDGRLSGSGQMSCASCHVAELGWADGRARALGHGAAQLERNTPSLLNAAHVEQLFWDGRAASLEELVLAVLANDREMDADPRQVVERLSDVAGYGPHFEQAFGDGEVTLERVARAVADHVRTLVSEPSAPFDRFLGGDVEALDDDALRGLHLFRTRAGCLNCHSGPLLTDGRFHNIGLSYYGRRYEDLGRHRVTGAAADVGAFRTPSLRNVARTAPYTHTGFLELAGLINVYDAGGARPRPRGEFVDDPLFPTTSELLVPLDLSARDKRDLLAFLESLSERRRRDMLPELP